MSEEEKHKVRMLAFALKQQKLKKKKKIVPPKEPVELTVVPDIPINGKVKGIDEMGKYDLDKELTRRRIKQTEVRTMAFEMDLARIREDLIEKELVVKQLSFLVVAMRQKILAIPTTYARKLLRKEDLKEVHGILQQMTFQLLEELKSLPQKVVDPNWLQTLDEEEDQPKK